MSKHASRHVPRDVEATSIGDVLPTFPQSSHISSTRTFVFTFMATEDFIPIKIEKVPGTLKCFN